MTEKVVRCDLRPHNQADAALQEVARLLADRSEPDLSLLLVIDRPQTLITHALAYEELWRSRRVEKLLGVAVGPLILPGSLELPGIIGPDRDSGVIWVGDPDGVSWRLAASAISNAHPNDNSGAGLDKLIDILSTPQVFKKTLSLIADIPEGVANPGLSVFEVTASQTMFLAALSRSIKKMLDPGPADLHSRLAVPDGPVWTVDAVRSTVLPTGRLAAARDRCLSEAEELTETVEALGTPVALYGTGRLGARARALAARAGGELSDYRRAAHDLVGSPAMERADRFYDWGIRPIAGPNSASNDIATAIDASIRAGEPLPLVSLRLRDYERKLRAQGDPPYAEQIEQLSPRALEQRFTDPEPMPGPEPWLVAVGAIATALAALGHGFGIVAGLVVALTSMGLLGLTVVRAPGGHTADHSGSLIAGGIAAVFGLAGGIEIARVLKPPPAAGGIGFLIGLSLVIVATSWSWQVRTRRWRAALQVEDLVKVTAELTNVVVAAANREWSAGESLQDAMITAKAVIDGAASALRRYQQKVDRDLTLESARHGAHQEFDGLVSRGLSMLVTNALSPILRASRAGSPREHEEWASTRVGELLAQWDLYVDEHGPLDLPEFANGQDPQISVLGENDIAAITAVITTEPRDAMWQLCRSADIRLLDFGITKVPSVRFAPRALLFSVSNTFSVETEWIGSTKHAGLLRLVPLRPGVVHRTWLTDEPADGRSIADGPGGEPWVDGGEIR